MNKELIELATVQYGFLIPFNKKVNAEEFSRLISENYDSPQSRKVAEAVGKSGMCFKRDLVEGKIIVTEN